eukprot:TRINITY_DN5099_c0_g1_i12.p1 TRINITY_DN5099_c0_g1~~TRINITY_DN5099_c0_g1_i12.p1  ORF type:complete len:439 (-),score=68.13 TRINITY_DN5099_c0_g1_i12:53-1369(-)
MIKNIVNFSLNRSNNLFPSSYKLVRRMMTSTEDCLQNVSTDVFQDEKNGDVKGDDGREVYKWKNNKKMACMLSFSGKDYMGMQNQRSQGLKTIEGELLEAFTKGGFIDPEWLDNPQKAFFQRASRTDKGVSALKMIISLKLPPDDPTLVPEMNAILPPDIRLQSVVRVTKNFNCKSAADARTYLYLTPTFAFSPVTDTISESWRSTPETIDNVNKVLKTFNGSHYFHNYTSGKLPLEPSSRRHIYEFTCGQPFENDGLEYCILKIKGQSFMLHQIRKMIGMTMAVVRGHTSLSKIEETFGMDRIDIPRAPGLGLVLDEVHFDRYNKRYGSDGIHEPLSWAKVEDQVTDFRDNVVFADIMSTEKASHSMLDWMIHLGMHRFVPRHFEEDGESSPLIQAALHVARDTKLKDSLEDTNANTATENVDKDSEEAPSDVSKNS